MGSSSSSNCRLWSRDRHLDGVHAPRLFSSLSANSFLILSGNFLHSLSWMWYFKSLYEKWMRDICCTEPLRNKLIHNRHFVLPHVYILNLESLLCQAISILTLNSRVSTLNPSQLLKIIMDIQNLVESDINFNNLFISNHSSTKSKSKFIWRFR